MTGHDFPPLQVLLTKLSSFSGYSSREASRSAAHLSCLYGVTEVYFLASAKNFVRGAPVVGSDLAVWFCDTHHPALVCQVPLLSSALPESSHLHSYWRAQLHGESPTVTSVPWRVAIIGLLKDTRAPH